MIKHTVVHFDYFHMQTLLISSYVIESVFYVRRGPNSIITIGK